VTDYRRPASLMREQDREIERLRAVHRAQAEGWAKTHAEVLRLRRILNGQETREEATGRLTQFLLGESGLDA